MRYSILITLLVVSVAFSVLNSTPVSVNFLLWRFDAPLAVAVMAALAFGLLAGALLMLPWGMRARRGLKHARRSADELEKRLRAAESSAKLAPQRLPASAHGSIASDDGE
jgi:putative membrane protein